jgi:hypothetical protein
LFNYGIGSLLTTLWAYSLAGTIGFGFACVTLLVMSQTRASWTWGVVIPVITITWLPSVHSPGEFLFGALVATVVTLLGMVIMMLKGHTSQEDRGLRAACKNKRFRIAASLYVGYCTLCAFVDGPPVSFVAAFSILVAMWWNEGLKVFLQALVSQGE